jgi:hypothetical protein
MPRLRKPEIISYLDKSIVNKKTLESKKPGITVTRDNAKSIIDPIVDEFVRKKSNYTMQELHEFLLELVNRTGLDANFVRGIVLNALIKHLDSIGARTNLRDWFRRQER